jgi:hypothetical protein
MMRLRKGAADGKGHFELSIRFLNNNKPGKIFFLQASEGLKDTAVVYY